MLCYTIYTIEKLINLFVKMTNSIKTHAKQQLKSPLPVFNKKEAGVVWFTVLLMLLG